MDFGQKQKMQMIGKKVDSVFEKYHLLNRKLIYSIIPQSAYYYFPSIIIQRRNTLLMFKIKSHNRYKSQEQLSINDKLYGKITVTSNSSSIQKQKIKNHNKIFTHNGINKIKLHQNIILNPIYSYRNSTELITSQRTQRQMKKNAKIYFRKQKQIIQKIQQELTQLCKQQFQQLNKKNILKQIINVMKHQFQQSKNKVRQQSNLQQSKYKELQIINKEKRTIQKILNQHNKNVDLNKQIQQLIKKQRKFRILNENYFYSLENELKKHQTLYYCLLLKSFQNKLFFLMLPSYDIVSNGHVLGFKKENSSQVESDLNKNTYMCLPKINQNSTSLKQHQIQRKSQKFIGKLGTIKKLTKILGLVQDSKALECSQLSLYQQDDYAQEDFKKSYSFFRTQKYIQRNKLPTKIQKKDSILKKKSSKKSKPRSGKIVSIKFMCNLNQYYSTSFAETVYELFRFYQSFGINIFAKSQLLQIKQQKKQYQNFFEFDEDLLVNQAQRRVQYIKTNIQKICKFNEVLDKKVTLIEENIHEIQNYKYQLQKKNYQKTQKKYIKCQCQEKQQKQNQENFIAISKLLNVRCQNFNSTKQVQDIIDQLNLFINQAKVKQIQTELNKDNQKGMSQDTMLYSQNQNQIYKIRKVHNQSDKSSTEIQGSFPALSSLNQKNNYFRKMMKTQGCQKKFHKLIKNEDYQLKNQKLNQSCRSIYENGMKSLDNIFQNLKICNSYQRAFQRQQFQKEYSKQITKKKRVMFRRQGKVLPQIS